MPTMPWAFGVGAVLVVASSIALRTSVQPTPSRRRIAWIKRLVALRSIASTVLGLLVFSAVLEAVASASDAVRWMLTFAAGGGLLAVVLNTLAALWLLSPFLGADLGLDVVASGLRGTIHGYGWARLELTTHAGWTALLPYASIAVRPFSVCRQDGPRMVELTLRRDQWHEHELQWLRQVAVFSPYRDPSISVSVSCRARVATVRLGLAQRATQERMQQYLERAVVHLRQPAEARGAGSR
jgi:hypothetical protein